MFGVSPAEAAGLSAQQEIAEKTEEISQNVSFVGGGQGEITGITGMQVSGGVFVTVQPFDLGLVGSYGWMSGVNVGTGGFAGLSVGGAENLRGFGSTFGAASPFGGSSVNLDSNNQPTALYWTSPSAKFGASGGMTRSCTLSLRGAGC